MPYDLPDHLKQEYQLGVGFDIAPMDRIARLETQVHNLTELSRDQARLLAMATEALARITNLLDQRSKI